MPLPLKEFELLEMLLRNAGRVLTRVQLIDRVWGSDYVGDTKTLDVHVKRLRAKIEPDPANPQLLTTVRGLGYKFERLMSSRLTVSVAGRRDGGVLAAGPAPGTLRDGVAALRSSTASAPEHRAGAARRGCRPTTLLVQARAEADAARRATR